ncbi:MAG TPA: ASCH domain-containing protein [Candidatus Nanoarchaeia archaeon]|nr:ASCH domain-containing protein [Candidatus Nanoarchaeia archaeon]
MKPLKFAEPLARLILEGKKDTTWRINDDKDIQENDELSLCYNDGKEFTKAKVTEVRETIFENLSEKNKEGHETFRFDKEMHKTYSSYYHVHVKPSTLVKVIKFKLEPPPQQAL